MTLECVKHVLAFPAVLIETLISLGYQDFTLPITARIIRFSGAGFDSSTRTQGELLGTSFQPLPSLLTPALPMIYIGYIFILTIREIHGILSHGRLEIRLPAMLQHPTS
jgi:hypothetical protein